MLQTAMTPSTPQKVFALSSIHCPSQGRTGDPCLEFRVALGRQLYTHRLDGVFAQQSVQWLAPALITRARILTCWLINKIAMSFLSVVNLSKASSIAVLSVLLSTTRKFFWESGGWVTCYISISFQRFVIQRLGHCLHQCQLGAAQLLSPAGDISSGSAYCKANRAYFVSDHSKELSIFVGRSWCCHDRVVDSSNVAD
jgi:hypothetical protein